MSMLMNAGKKAAQARAEKDSKKKKKAAAAAKSANRFDIITSWSDTRAGLEKKNI